MAIIIANAVESTCSIARFRVKKSSNKENPKKNMNATKGNSKKYFTNPTSFG